MGLILGGVSANDLILDGQSVSLYIGGSPPVKVWPTREKVQITLGTEYQARDQFRAALTARGLDYRTVTEIPFDIELVGTGVTDHMFDYCSNLIAVPALNTSGSTSMKYMFRDCKNLKEAPAMDTSNVTDMTQMFYQCSSMTYVPDMHTSQASVMGHMFFRCSALTDGNVRLIGKHPNVNTNLMIYMSGLTREPFYVAAGEYEVSLDRVQGNGTVHSLLPSAVLVEGTWKVRIQGTITQSGSDAPHFRIGGDLSGTYSEGATVDFAGTVTTADRTIAMVTHRNDSRGRASFSGTVTIEK